MFQRVFRKRASVISHGVALRLSSWKKRLFLAESKLQFFEKKYRTTLAELDAKGLADDADYEMHEDYITWHHWVEAVQKAEKQISTLQVIATYGLQN